MHENVDKCKEVHTFFSSWICPWLMWAEDVAWRSLTFPDVRIPRSLSDSESDQAKPKVLSNPSRSVNLLEVNKGYSLSVVLYECAPHKWL